MRTWEHPGCASDCRRRSCARVRGTCFTGSGLVSHWHSRHSCSCRGWWGVHCARCSCGSPRGPHPIGMICWLNTCAGLSDCGLARWPPCPCSACSSSTPALPASWAMRLAAWCCCHSSGRCCVSSSWCSIAWSTWRGRQGRVLRRVPWSRCSATFSASHWSLWRCWWRSPSSVIPWARCWRGWALGASRWPSRRKRR